MTLQEKVLKHPLSGTLVPTFAKLSFSSLMGKSVFKKKKKLVIWVQYAYKYGSGLSVLPNSAMIDVMQFKFIG